jgi:hypothetical protein
MIAAKDDKLAKAIAAILVPPLGDCLSMCACERHLADFQEFQSQASPGHALTAA